jgi:hypothetical protein
MVGLLEVYHEKTSDFLSCSLRCCYERTHHGLRQCTSGYDFSIDCHKHNGGNCDASTCASEIIEAGFKCRVARSVKPLFRISYELKKLLGCLSG